MRFPALGAGYMYLPQILIGSSEICSEPPFPVQTHFLEQMQWAVGRKNRQTHEWNDGLIDGLTDRGIDGQKETWMNWWSDVHSAFWAWYNIVQHTFLLSLFLPHQDMKILSKNQNCTCKKKKKSESRSNYLNKKAANDQIGKKRRKVTIFSCTKCHETNKTKWNQVWRVKVKLTKNYKNYQLPQMLNYNFLMMEQVEAWTICKTKILYFIFKCCTMFFFWCYWAFFW